MNKINCFGVDIGTRKIAVVGVRGKGKVVIGLELPLEKVKKTPLMPRLVTAETGLAPILRNAADVGVDSFVYVERPIGGMNLNVTIALAQVQAAAMLGGASAFGMGFVNEVIASEWKKRVIGRGNANKQDIADYCKRQGLDFESQDLCDAYCIALFGYYEIKRGSK